MRRASGVLAGLLCVAAALGCGASEPEPAARWERAQRLWRDRSPRAYKVWSSIDPQTAPGRKAHRRLREAEEHYREGIRRLREDEPGVREALQRGVNTAPMDPELYLPLARACRERGLVLRADEYYKKFLAAHPEGRRARAARRELRALDPKLAGVFERPPQGTDPRKRAEEATGAVSIGSAIAGALGVLVVLALVAAGVWWRRRGRTLAELAARRPELHPTIAYLVGSLRHELLKHRVGAAGDAVEALRRGDATSSQLALVRDRLGGCHSLREAWTRHIGELERTLGRELALWRDPAFRQARRAVRTLERLAPRVSALGPREVDRLVSAHGRLRELDRALARLVGSLVRTRVDDDLLREVVEAVRHEHAAGAVALDELSVGAVDEPASVEVFRMDLVLVLKNLVRNAIFAVGREPPPRRVSLDATTTIEATGEEIVRLCVRDSSRERLPADALRLGRMERGLGLVAAAVTRYGGSIDVEPAGGEWAKAIVVRFFRADDGEDVAEPAEAAAAKPQTRAA